MLDFLRVDPPISEEELRSRLSLSLERFHRKKTRFEITYIQTEQEQEIRNAIERTIKMLSSESSNEVYVESIDDYLK